MRHVWPLDIEFGNAHMKHEGHMRHDGHHMHHGEPKLGRGFVVYQKFENLYSPMEALKNATAFEDLNQPGYKRKP